MNELVFLAEVERWVPLELSARVDENTAGPGTALRYGRAAAYQSGPSWW